MPPPRRFTIEPLEQRVLLNGTGLAAQYFHNSDFTGLAYEQTEAVNFDWGQGAPAAGVAPSSYSVRWSGQVEPAFTETYSFHVESSGGVRLWVDGTLIVDAWSLHALRTDSGSIALVAGQRYDIRLEYWQDIHSAAVKLRWSSNSQPQQLIPTDQLHASASGLLGRYADSFGNQVTRVEPAIDFNWGTGSPLPPVAADNFRVSYTGQVRANFGEQYTFAVDSAGPVRLWIGNELIIENWTEHVSTTDTGTKTLEPGKWYDIRLELEDEADAAEISLRWSSPRQTDAGVFETVPTANLRASLDTPLTFTNPLGPGADPYVVQWDGNYLLVRSQGNSVRIDRAEQLQDIHRTNPNSSTVTAWTAPPGTNYSAQIWAPELHQLDGKWYIYVAASDGNNSTHRMHVLERDAPDPFGPYVYKGKIAAATDRWAIDGTVLSWQGTNYFVWSGWPGFSDGLQNLYIAAMENPWTLSTNRVLLSTPQFAWEQVGLSINEGPQILINDGHLHIIYSGSGFWTPDYALGRLTYDGSGSLLDPSNWSKATSPVFRKTSQVVGTGHASFTRSPDGTEDWIVFHAHANPDVFNEDRVIRMQPFVYFGNGTPNFGVPHPPATVLQVPSGSPQADSSPLEGDYNASGRVDEEDLNVWRATFGQTVFPYSGADGNGNGIIDAADYTVWQNRQGAVVQQPAAAAAATGMPIDAPPPSDPAEVSELHESDPQQAEPQEDASGSTSRIFVDSFFVVDSSRPPHAGHRAHSVHASAVITSPSGHDLLWVDQRAGLLGRVVAAGRETQSAIRNSAGPDRDARPFASSEGDRNAAISRELAFEEWLPLGRGQL